MISHDALFSVPAEFRGSVNPIFKPESKHAGWIDMHGKSLPVTRHAIGRVAERYVKDVTGGYVLQVSEYYALKPHDKPLRLIPGEEVVGLSGQEIVVSFAMSIQEANKHKFSHSKLPMVAEVIPMGRITANVA